MSNFRAASPAEIAAAIDAAQKVVEIHRLLAEFLRIGQTVAQVDTFVAKTQATLGCKSCFLGYKVRGCPPFPSHACLSVNDCVVHGTAASHLAPLRPGDVLKIDIGVKYRGWIGDAAWTYAFGTPTAQVRSLMDCGKEALRLGAQQIRPGTRMIEWAKTVQAHVERTNPFHCIRHWGGHGYGRELHGPPHLNNHIADAGDTWDDADRLWKVGDLIAAEPMIAVGSGKTFQKSIGKQKDWPVFVEGGSMSVHYEHDILVTPEGPRVLTQGLQDLPDEVLR